MTRLIAVLSLTLMAAPLYAQAAPPSTDIYLVQLERGATAITATPENVTHRAGYDNQPAFTPDGRSLLFTSIHEDGQADTYRLDLRTLAITRVTNTREDEYSPTPMPGSDGFSVVRVERDSAQRLWAFDASGGNPKLLLPDVAPVGYHLWLDTHTLALFVLGTPNSLQIADTRTGRGRVIAHDIGRSLQRVPGSERFSFIQLSDSAAWLATADTSASGNIQRIVQLPPRADYVVWQSPTVVLTAAGTALYRLDLSHGSAGATWTPVADFRNAGLRGISRLALSPDGTWLALVATPVNP